MNRLAEFIGRHPYLTSLVIALAIAASVIEIRHRRLGAAAVGPMDAVRLINGGAVVIDVRAREAYAAGHIIDARNIAHSDLIAQPEQLKKFREKTLLLYCETGATSAATARALKAQGFGQVIHLRGGLTAWKQDNLPTVTETKSGKNKGGK